MTSKVVVGGKTYNVIKGGGYISKDDGDTYSSITESSGKITTDLKNATGGDATVYMSPSMTVAAILTGKGSGASSIYGVINDAKVESLVNGKVTKSIEVMLPDGSFATYAPDKDSEIEVDGAAASALVAADFGTKLKVDQFVQISLNSDGYIDVIKTGSSIQDYTNFGIAGGGAANIAGDKDAMTVTINGNKYDVSKAVIFNTSLTTPGDDDEVDIVGLAEFIDNADSTITGSTGIYAKVKKGAIEYFVFNNGGVLGSNNKLAMVTGTGTDSDGAYVKLMTIGDPVQYSVKSAAVDYAKGDVVNYNLSSGKVKINDMTKLTPVWKEIGTKLSIDSINGNIFEIGGINYSVDKDTLYFDYTGKNPVLAEKDDFSADDSVLVYQEKAGDVISAIVLVK
ncbi:MAG: hypothetical protein GXY49_00005, partial [Syntrophomonadaceae bacterium]|nr:hypothetical protein [Syntrophomonadaceae bacterium]